MIKDARIIIVTGLSGAGKSNALKALEDIGFFCVDNLPVVLLPQFIEIQTGKKIPENKVAIAMDIREKAFIEDYPKVFTEIKDRGYAIEILFLEASSHILRNRFSETRREHPLTGKETLEEKIIIEKELLQPLREVADITIDTTGCNVHQLKEIVRREFLLGATSKRLVINIYSFGYKNGLPQDADIVLDVRFLINPHFIAELKEQKGSDAPVKEYVLKFAETKKFLENFFVLLEFLLPLYEKEGKPHLSVALGCTAGRHRSVVIVEEVAKHLEHLGYLTNVIHRDIGRS
ncbi:MAG: RNase adapter RapZ [Deltaproteobacteria bacterium]|nr:RNase adapter RapZ [Deltaproteobacteria bacterium]